MLISISISISISSIAASSASTQMLSVHQHKRTALNNVSSLGGTSKVLFDDDSDAGESQSDEENNDCA